MQQNTQLRDLSFEDIIKLKDEIGENLYREAVFGTNNRKHRKDVSTSKPNTKCLSKHQPRMATSKRQTPFFGTELKAMKVNIRDPRFDEKAGRYNANTFKQNYKFLSKIREKEVAQLKTQLKKESDPENRKKLNQSMQKLINKNREDQNWHRKQNMMKEEQREIQKAHDEGRQPHYTTKKERLAKELVFKFKQLKKTGKLDKYMEKRRKKIAAKDRKKMF